MACDLQCGGTRQSASSEEAKEGVPSPQPGLLRGAYCPGYAPRIPCRRPRPNHSGVTPGAQGIHMTQNLYYSVVKRAVIMHISSYALPQRATHFSNWTAVGSRSSSTP